MAALFPRLNEQGICSQGDIETSPTFAPEFKKANNEKKLSLKIYIYIHF